MKLLSGFMIAFLSLSVHAKTIEVPTIDNSFYRCGTQEALDGFKDELSQDVKAEVTNYLAYIENKLGIKVDLSQINFIAGAGLSLKRGGETTIFFDAKAALVRSDYQGSPYFPVKAHVLATGEVVILNFLLKPSREAVTVKWNENKSYGPLGQLVADLPDTCSLETNVPIVTSVRLINTDTERVVLEVNQSDLQ